VRERRFEFTVDDVLERWAKRFECVQTWLSKAYHSFPEKKTILLFYFCDWAKLDPNALLELKKDANNLEAEHLLDRFVVEAPFTDSVRWACSMVVRSFFKRNYRELQGEAGKVDYVAKKDSRAATKGERFKFYEACFNPRDQALVLVAFSSGLAEESLTHLKWCHFEENWQNVETPHISLGSESIKGHGKGKYKGVRQETFISGEAKRALVKMMDWMIRNHLVVAWTPSDHVFLRINKPIKPLGIDQITKIFYELSKRSGVKCTSHDGRRILETTLESAGVSRNWIQKMKGRKVRGEDAPYSRPAIEQLREAYKRALDEIEFLSEVGLSPQDRAIRDKMRDPAWLKEQEEMHELYEMLKMAKPWMREDLAKRLRRP
jgi:hypothetical protein